MIVIDLFCGTKSIGNAFERAGHDVFTIDYDSQHCPDMKINILDFKINMLPVEFRRPHVIWASPPCQTFSVASIGRHWTLPIYTPKTEACKIGIAIMEKTVEIIKKMNPEYYFIENPRGIMRKMEIMRRLPDRKTVTYCQYGDKRMKPTDIWTNCFIWNPKPRCSNGDDCHEPAPRGSSGGTQALSGAVARSRIPKLLCEEIVKLCETGNNGSLQ